MKSLPQRNDETGFGGSVEDAIFEAALHSTGCYHHYNGNDIAIGHDEGGSRFTIWLINKDPENTNTQIGSVMDSLPWDVLVETVRMIVHCIFK